MPVAASNIIITLSRRFRSPSASSGRTEPDCGRQTLPLRPAISGTQARWTKSHHKQTTGKWVARGWRMDPLCLSSAGNTRLRAIHQEQAMRSCHQIRQSHQLHNEPMAMVVEAQLIHFVFGSVDSCSSSPVSPRRTGTAKHASYRTTPERMPVNFYRPIGVWTPASPPFEKNHPFPKPVQRQHAQSPPNADVY